MKNTLKIFSGRSNLTLAQGIVDVLGMDLGDVTIRTVSYTHLTLPTNREV